MKFSVTNEALLGPLQVVSGIIEKKPSNQILSNVLLSVEDDCLTITGANGEIEMVTRLHLDGEQHELGEITVPGKKLYDICRSIREDETIHFSVKEGKVTVAHGQSRFSLISLPANEFPNILELGHAKTIQLEQSTLKALFDYTQFAMAQQDVRFYLNGLLLKIGAGHVRAVATDGHRMALATMAMEGLDEECSVIIPRKSVVELGKLLADGPIKISIDDNHLFVLAEHFTFISKLVDGRFPDYEKVILKHAAKNIVVGREAFKEALVQAAILCDEKLKGVRLAFEPGKITLYSNNPQQEQAEIEVASDYSGENFEIGFNINYLIDVMQIMRSDNVSILLDANHTNALFEEQDGNDCQYVVMPMLL